MAPMPPPLRSALAEDIRAFVSRDVVIKPPEIRSISGPCFRGGNPKVCESILTFGSFPDTLRSDSRSVTANDRDNWSKYSTRS